MLHSNRSLALLVFLSLLAACLGQVVMLSAAPHPQSMRVMRHVLRQRFAYSLQHRWNNLHTKRPHVSVQREAI